MEVRLWASEHVDHRPRRGPRILHLGAGLGPSPGIGAVHPDSPEEALGKQSATSIRSRPARSNRARAEHAPELGRTSARAPTTRPGSAPSEPRPRPSASRPPGCPPCAGPAVTDSFRLLRRSNAGPCISQQSNRPTDPRPVWRPGLHPPGFGITAGHFLVIHRRAAEQDGRGKFLASLRTRQSPCHPDGLLVLAERSQALRPSWSSLLRPTRATRDQKKATRTLTAG